MSAARQRLADADRADRRLGSQILRRPLRPPATDSALSHPHPVCRAACAAFAAAIAAAAGGGDRAAMLADSGAGMRAEAGPEAAPVLLALRQAAAGVAPTDFQHQMGWVLIALQNAFHHLAAGTGVGAGADRDRRQRRRYRHQRRHRRRPAWRGGRTGIAAGAVGLAGADLPARPGPASARPRPEAYWPDDLLDLTEALAAQARRREITMIDARLRQAAARRRSQTTRSRMSWCRISCRPRAWRPCWPTCRRWASAGPFRSIP